MKKIFLLGIVFLFLFSFAGGDTTDFNTDDDDCDGYVFDGHACGASVDNTGNDMEAGVDGVNKCFLDNTANIFHSDGSFPTGSIPDSATITGVELHIYLESIEKTAGLTWSFLYDARLEISTAKDQIGDTLTYVNYNYGTIRYSSAAFKNWAVGWKTIDLGVDSVYKDGDTDIEIRPNGDWYTDLNAQGKKFILHFTTNEGGANKPYLRVTYTVPSVCGVSWDETGNWVIDGENAVCTNENYDWTGQNITLINGGNLTLINSNITIDMSSNFISGDGVGFFRGDKDSKFI